MEDAHNLISIVAGQAISILSNVGGMSRPVAPAAGTPPRDAPHMPIDLPRRCCPAAHHTPALLSAQFPGAPTLTLAITASTLIDPTQPQSPASTLPDPTGAATRITRQSLPAITPAITSVTQADTRHQTIDTRSRQPPPDPAVQSRIC
ncbi:hypothetical protein C0992_009152 [Termitomyces sp. T32_za158]|nr:hypothetical protein C0992_009152 [Termitomyces sp. T32_za158]